MVCGRVWVMSNYTIKCILLMYVIVGKRKRRREESSDPESDIYGMSLHN